MEAILVNYNFTPTWLRDYPEFNPVTIFDRSEDGNHEKLFEFGKVYRQPNFGDVDFAKLSYLIENYDNLPEVFLWSKTNIFKFISEDEFKMVRNNSTFTPLLTLSHRIYGDQWGQVNKYQGGIYYERADSWFFNAGLDNSGRFHNWQEWAYTFGLPQESYIPFAPGGSYILTREAVRKNAKDLYIDMRDTLPYARRPVEAHCCERSYYYIFR